MDAHDALAARPATESEAQPSGVTGAEGEGVGVVAPSTTDGAPPGPAQSPVSGSRSVPPRGPRRRRPTKIIDCKRGIGDALLDLKAADVGQPGKARTLIYGFAQLASVIESERLSDLEARIARLEAAAARQGGNA